MESRSAETVRKRPLLIYILIGIHTVFGLFVLSIVTNGLISRMTLHFPQFIWSMLFIVILACSIGGMWEGKPFGWWCSLFLYTSGILQSSSKIVLGISGAVYLDMLLGCFKLTVLILLFGKKYRKYFGVETISLPISMFKVSIASVLFIGAMFLFFGTPQS